MPDRVRLIRSGVYLIQGTEVLWLEGTHDQDKNGLEKGGSEGNFSEGSLDGKNREKGYLAEQGFEEKSGTGRNSGNGKMYDRQGRRAGTSQLGLDPDRLDPRRARENTISYRILSAHNTSAAEGTPGNREVLKIRFDALASHDITYVGIVQTARASGLKEFPVPYVLTNCHNSLGAVGGTINEDDHLFGLSAAQKYGGIYVPAHQAVIHQYMRETMARCGSMILGSDSHTRYGALGTMGIGEGGPELVKQLLEKTYDISYPEIIAVYLAGKPQPGVGPQDVALALIGAVFKNGFVKNKVLEFVGPGIGHLSVDYRNGIDTMTTETACLSSIWRTDEQVREYFQLHGRPEGYAKLEPGEVAYYDGMVMIDLDKVEPMIALPFHPSNVYSISELNRNAREILAAAEAEGQKQLDNPAIRFSLTDHLAEGRLTVDQAIVAGCAGGTFENLAQVAAIVDRQTIGNGALSFSVYPASQPVYLKLVENGAVAKMTRAGVTVKTAFCGPCFGAGDVPANGSLSIRHTTRNFPNREGSKPGEGQIASVALMDARSIAATAINGGRLTPATELNWSEAGGPEPYAFDREIYAHRVYQGFTSPRPQRALQFGPNIADWPKMIPLPANLLLQVAAVIHDPVTSTDELIPSGETSSYRSNPLKLAEFTLSRKDPDYVGRAKRIRALEWERLEWLRGERTGSKLPESEQSVNQRTVDERLSKDGVSSLSESLKEVWLRVLKSSQTARGSLTALLESTGIGTTIYAVKPGDGSAREQAASCQKVLGGWANIAEEYATKRYRSNLINWGMLPFTVEGVLGRGLKVDDLIFIPDIRTKLSRGEEVISAELITPAGVKSIELWLRNLTADEREIILAGCLINDYVGK